MVKVSYLNGDVYEGKFKDGKKSGFGMLQYKSLLSPEDGSLEWGHYEGNWKANLRNGSGRMRWSDGSEFEGLWVNDERVNGTMRMIDGTLYTGNFKNDKLEGPGRLKTVTGEVFDGVFVGGKCPKQGKLTFEDGSVYFGEVSESLGRQGVGKGVFKNGDVYEGQWQDVRSVRDIIINRTG